MSNEKDDLDRLAERVFKHSGSALIRKTNQKVLKLSLSATTLFLAIGLLVLYFLNRLNTLSLIIYLVVAALTVTLIILGATSGWYRKNAAGSLANIVLRKISRDLAFAEDKGVVKLKEGLGIKVYRDMTAPEKMAFHVAIAINAVTATDLFPQEILYSLIEVKSQEDVVKLLKESDELINLDSITKILINA